MMEMGCTCIPLINPTVSRKVGIIFRRRYQLSLAATAMKETIIKYLR